MHSQSVQLYGLQLREGDPYFAVIRRPLGREEGVGERLWVPPLGLKYEKLDESRKRSEPDTVSEASPESGRLNARR